MVPSQAPNPNPNPTPNPNPNQANEKAKGLTPAQAQLLGRFAAAMHADRAGT